MNRWIWTGSDLTASLLDLPYRNIQFEHGRWKMCSQSSTLIVAVVPNTREPDFERSNHHVSLMGPDPSDAWHRMPQKILHPMPRKSEIRDFQISGNPDFRRFGSPEIWKYGFSDSRKSGFSEIGFLIFRKTRNSGFSGIPIFRIFGKSENPKIR